MGFQNMSNKLSLLRSVVLAALLVLAGLFPFHRAVQQSEQQFASVVKSDWAATGYWLEAAECTRKTHAWLVACGKDGRLIPLSDRSVADDPGHAFLLSVYAMVEDRPLTLVDVAKFNVAINFVGFVSIIGLLLWMRAYIAMVIVVLLSAAFQYSIGISPHPGFVGAATMASVMPLVLYKILVQPVTRWETALLLLWGMLALGCAALLREPIGTMGFLISIATLLVLAWWRKPRPHLGAVLALALLSLLSWKTPHGVLAARDALFDVEPAKLIQTHGIAHNLYIGLGIVENKFGIEWLDSSASDAVARVDPKIPYVSEKYYQTLWQLYWQRVQEDPVEVLRIYSVKVSMMLLQPMPLVHLPLLIVVLGLLAMLGLGARGILDPGRQATGAWGVVALALAFILFFVLQGVLAHPGFDYALPIGAFSVMGFGASVELLVREYKRRGGAALGAS